MKNKIKHLLENVIEEIIVGTIIAGCAVTQINAKNILQRYTNKNKGEYVEFRQGEIQGISEGDTFLLEPYVAPKEPAKEIPESRYLTDIEIDNLLNRQYKKVKLPNYISKDYVKALIWQESSNNPRAISSWGARGLLQLLENTWYNYETSSYDEVFNPEKNIYAGLRHIKWIDSYCEKNYPNYLELSNEEKQDVLSAVYNVGVGKFERKSWDISKMPRETRNHVKKVREKYNKIENGSGG